MTDAKVLADALVEAGILTKGGHITYYFPDGEMAGRGAEHTITDWRVAGKVLESVTGNNAVHLARDAVYDYFQGMAYGGLPRAIIEAWYAATEKP